MARSFERIHRSNLIGMGVLPLQFKAGESWESLGITGDETIDVVLGAEIKPQTDAKLTITGADGEQRERESHAAHRHRDRGRLLQARRHPALRWHRVRSDELWCHLEGAPIELHRLDDRAPGAAPTLLSDRLAPPSPTTQPLCNVPAGQWQAARTCGAWSLAACFVAPGFDFADFELMRHDDPQRAWLAQHAASLERGF